MFSSPLFALLSVGARTVDKLENDIVAYEHHLDKPMAQRYRTFATAGLGFDLTAESWPTLTQVFASGSERAFSQCPGRPSCPRLPPVERLPMDCLDYVPINLLVLGDLSPARATEWLNRIPSGGDPAPKLVLEFWDDFWVVKATGPMAKSSVKEVGKEGLSVNVPNNKLPPGWRCRRPSLASGGTGTRTGVG
jgi:hypothetical protein